MTHVQGYGYRRIALVGVALAMGWLAMGGGPALAQRPPPPAPVLGPGGVPADPALGPNAVPNNPALAPDQTNPAPVYAPDNSDSLGPLKPIFPDSNQ